MICHENTRVSIFPSKLLIADLGLYINAKFCFPAEIAKLEGKGVDLQVDLVNFQLEATNKTAIKDKICLFQRVTGHNLTDNSSDSTLSEEI